MEQTGGEGINGPDLDLGKTRVSLYFGLVLICELRTLSFKLEFSPSSISGQLRRSITLGLVDGMTA
ncbi:hypothetical protein [Sinorhizobium meliloti]|uniref:hypothetical protein n=1 Tax=Rhizobium meliloti TaxID=382 RepID=UPI00129612DA|nr:hypothetical protein [Sinorhizobium meliloti]MDE3812585.1 hypothetical protein [Sinorhizobium meliloti]MQW28531.1 hypothetical protein [Sinorhizobium meliloti]